MTKSKTETVIGLVILISICVMIPSSATYYFVNEYKEIEMNNFVENYKTQIIDYEKEIDNLKIINENFSEQIPILEQRVLILDTEVKDLLKRNVDDDKRQKFDKLLVKGIQKQGDGDWFSGYAEAYYGEASSSYEEDVFYWGWIYAGYADVYYGSASNLYRDAKAYFSEAKQYTTNEKTMRLATLYVEYMEYCSQVANEMHVANEYFSSACNYYYNGNYEIGSAEIATMNVHIRNHDNLIFDLNDLKSEIDALLDNFLIE